MTRYPYAGRGIHGKGAIAATTGESAPHVVYFAVMGANSRRSHSDAARAFVRRFPDVSALGREEAERVLPLAQAGVPWAQERMLGAVSRTIALAAKVAHRRCPVVPVEDLCQEAALSVVRQGIPKFDPATSLWNTYAGFWIRAAIGRHTIYDRTIRVPEGTFRSLGVRVDTVSFEAPTIGSPEGDGEGRLEDKLAAEMHDLVDARWAGQMRDRASALVRPPTFSAREAYLYFRRYRQQATLQAVGVTIGVSRERARQIEGAILDRLSKLLEHAAQPLPYGDRCIGWPKPRCGAVVKHPSGHCDLCWRRLERQAIGPREAR